MTALNSGASDCHDSCRFPLAKACAKTHQLQLQPRLAQKKKGTHSKGVLLCTFGLPREALLPRVVLPRGFVHAIIEVVGHVRAGLAPALVLDRVNVEVKEVVSVRVLVYDVDVQVRVRLGREGSDADAEGRERPVGDKTARGRDGEGRGFGTGRVGRRFAIDRRCCLDSYKRGGKSSPPGCFGDLRTEPTWDCDRSSWSCWYDGSSSSAKGQRRASVGPGLVCAQVQVGLTEVGAQERKGPRRQ